MSSDAVVVSILFPGRISYCRKGSRMHPENEDFREFLRFVENVRGASRRLLERIGMLESGFRMFRKVADVFSEGIQFARKNSKIAISDTLGVHNAMVRAQTKDFGEEKGSTSHPAR